MDSPSSHHNQDTLESILVSSKPHPDKKPRPLDHQSLKCPRCDSSNTKFCYYNNYSLSQPRYFCKSCRRYWTKGGTLRNVPVGGGCRKNKRGPSSSASSTSSRRSQDHHPMGGTTPITPPTSIPCLSHPLTYDGSDLSLAIARLQKQGGLDEHDFGIWGNPNIPLSDVVGMSMNSSSGFLENHGPSMVNGLSYYGEMGMQEMGVIPYQGFTSSTAMTNAAAPAVKQEICSGRDGENRVLWGFPWQNLGGDGNAGEFGASHWHGLLNSALM